MTPMDMERVEGAFYEYMHQSGESGSAWNRDVLSFYAPMFANCSRVLDVGCGEGQFIELLQKEGVEVVGIDSDSTMVEVCLQKELDVVHADLFDYLPEHTEQFDGIFSSNLIEHLSARDATRFLQACHRALSVDGILLIATPNPASLIVQLHEFWRDATHVRLYSRPLLEFLLHWAGFGDIESGEHPHTAWALPPDMEELPRVLAEIGDEPTADRPFPFLAQSTVNPEKSAFRRLSYALRRRLAQLLVQNILYEEFASMQQTLMTHHQALRTLYGSHTGPLIRARECYVKGTKSAVETSEEP